tara:strand:+ start:1637 stop:2323 length:687 start_codon:yes stop_codon:yes gene_type:complete
MAEEYLTIAEFAKLHRYSIPTIRNWVKSGKLETEKLGRAYRIRVGAEVITKAKESQEAELANLRYKKEKTGLEASILKSEKDIKSIHGVLIAPQIILDRQEELDKLKEELDKLKEELDKRSGQLDLEQNKLAIRSKEIKKRETIIDQREKDLKKESSTYTKNFEQLKVDLFDLQTRETALKSTTKQLHTNQENLKYDRITFDNLIKEWDATNNKGKLAEKYLAGEVSL